MIVSSCTSETRTQYDSGFAEGEKRAEHQIQRNKMTIYTKGKTDQRVTHDVTTGLKREHLGCEISPYEDGLYDGHNKKILEFLKRKNP